MNWMSNMLESASLREIAYKKYESYKTKSADDLNKKECVRCGFCCYVRPCIPSKDELIKISKFLKLSVKEMINKFFCFDKIRGERVVIPIRENQKDIVGTFINFRRTWDVGYCIFLDEKDMSCKIHSVKPKHAIDSNCWDVKEIVRPSYTDKDLKELGINPDVFDGGE